MENELFIIVVLYFPKEDAVKRINELAKVYNVVAVDNTPSDSKEYKAIDEYSKYLQYIPLYANFGIAYAQNKGIERAKQSKAQYVLFLDQDSEVQKDFPNAMLFEYKTLKCQIHNLGILGPLIVNKDTMQNYKFDNSQPIKKNIYKQESIISSGSIVEVATFDLVGGLEDKLFIDVVDHEFCWRLQYKGYACCMTANVLLIHRVGNNTKKILCFNYIASAPFRYYYQYRNTLLMLRRSYVPMQYKIRSIIKNTFFLIVLPFVIDRKKRLSTYKYIFKGIKYGIINKY